MATQVTAAKAKAEFAEWVRKAEAGDPVVITRHGKEVVALVRADRLRQLAMQLRRRARLGWRPRQGWSAAGSTGRR